MWKPLDVIKNVWFQIDHVNIWKSFNVITLGRDILSHFISFYENLWNK